MKKIYLEPRTEAMEIENEGMLCSSGVDGDFSSNAAEENAKVRFMDDWDEEE